MKEKSHDGCILPSAFDSSFNSSRTGSERRLMAARRTAVMGMNSLIQSECGVQVLDLELLHNKVRTQRTK